MPGHGRAAEEGGKRCGQRRRSAARRGSHDGTNARWHSRRAPPAASAIGGQAQASCRSLPCPTHPPNQQHTHCSTQHKQAWPKEAHLLCHSQEQELQVLRLGVCAARRAVGGLQQRRAQQPWVGREGGEGRTVHRRPVPRRHRLAVPRRHRQPVPSPTDVGCPQHRQAHLHERGGGGAGRQAIAGAAVGQAAAAPKQRAAVAVLRMVRRQLAACQGGRRRQGMWAAALLWPGRRQARPPALAAAAALQPLPASPAPAPPAPACRPRT